MARHQHIAALYEKIDAVFEHMRVSKCPENLASLKRIAIGLSNEIIALERAA